MGKEGGPVGYEREGDGGGGGGVERPGLRGKSRGGWRGKEEALWQLEGEGAVVA